MLNQRLTNVEEAGNTTGFNLGDKLTFTDSVWSYDAATECVNHNGQILAHNIIFV